MATILAPALNASRLTDRPRPPHPMRPMFSFSLAPRALTAGTPKATAPAAAVEEARNERRVGEDMGGSGRRKTSGFRFFGGEGYPPPDFALVHFAWDFQAFRTF